MARGHAIDGGSSSTHEQIRRDLSCCLNTGFENFIDKARRPYWTRGTPDETIKAVRDLGETHNGAPTQSPDTRKIGVDVRRMMLQRIMIMRGRVVGKTVNSNHNIRQDCVSRGFPMTKDLRNFIEAVTKKAPEQFLTIRQEVCPKWELSSIQKQLENENKFPLILFERVRGHDMKVVTNLFSSRRLLALALDTTVESVAGRLMEARRNRIKPVMVHKGPVKDVIIIGDKVDLKKLPVVTHCEKDVGPYITAGIMITRDLGGSLNAGIYRNRLLSSDRLTANFAPLTHAAQIADKAEAEGKELDAAIVVGHHPAMGICSQFRGQLGEFELEVMGGLLGEPVEMVPCETIDLPVPADAEIVIEGKIKPGVRDVDGPFGDYWLYYAQPVSARVFEVTAITHRYDAIYHDIYSVGPEHVILFSLGMEEVVLTQLRQIIPQVKAINIPPSGVTELVYVQIKKDCEGLGVNAALAALGIMRFKCAIVVDEDIDIYDDRKVVWAVMTRTQPDRSFFTVQGSYVSRTDPAAYPPWQRLTGQAILSTRLGVDATKPLDANFPEVAEPPRSMWAEATKSW